MRRKAQEVVADEPILVRRCPFPVGPPDARGSGRGPRRVRGRRRSSRRRTATFRRSSNTWVYDGLMVFACVIAGSHAYLVARERAAWTVITLALALLDVRRDLVRDLQAQTYPSLADVGLHRLLPPALRRHRPAAALACPFDRRHALARRRDRRARSCSARRGRDRRGGAREHLGLDDHGRRRTCPTRSATLLLLSAFFGVFSLTGWRPGDALAPPRAGDPVDGDGRRRSTCSSLRTGRTSRARGSTSSGPRRSC